MQIKPAEIQGLAEAMRAVDDVAKRHVPYATSIMINRTLEEIMVGARVQIQQRMTVRVPRFTLPPQQLPKAAQATRQRPQGQAALGYGNLKNDPVGDRRDKLFQKFETGGTKTARDPQVPIAIPTDAIRRSFGDLVPTSLYPKNLRLVPKRVKSGKTLPALKRGKVRTLDGAAISTRARKVAGLEGVGGTFTINDEHGQPIGIFQRVGRGKERSDIRMLWAYKQQIRIPDLLDFFALADQIIKDRIVINWEGALALALQTAR